MTKKSGKSSKKSARKSVPQKKTPKLPVPTKIMPTPRPSMTIPNS